MKKIKGKLLTEQEAIKIAQNGGEVWLSYIEYGYKEIVVEKPCRVKYNEQNCCLDLLNETVETMQLTEDKDDVCMDDGFGDYELALYKIEKETE